MNTTVKSIAIASVLALTSAAAVQAGTINSDFSQGSSESASAVLHAENTGVSLDNTSVLVDYIVGGNLAVGDDFTGINQATSGETFQGTGTYDSFLIHFDPLGSNGGAAAGDFTFTGEIVAIIVSNGAGNGNNNTSAVQLLNDSDALFGNATYEQTLSRRSEGHDEFTLDDAFTLSYAFETGSGFIDNIRVITQAADGNTAPVPLPAGGLLLLAGMGAFGALRAKARRAS